MHKVDWEAVRQRQLDRGERTFANKGYNGQMHIRSRSIQLTAAGHREALIATLDRAAREGRGAR